MLFDGIINEGAKRHDFPPTPPLQHDPRIKTLSRRSASARNRVKEMFSRRTRREPGRSSYLAKHTDQRSALVDREKQRLADRSPGS